MQLLGNSIKTLNCGKIKKMLGNLRRRINRLKEVKSGQIMELSYILKRNVPFWPIIQKSREILSMIQRLFNGSWNHFYKNAAYMKNALLKS